MSRWTWCLVAIVAPSCAVPNQRPDLAAASIVQTVDEVWVDVPHLGNLRHVEATVRATTTNLETSGRVAPASTSIRFAGLAPGSYTLSIRGKTADASPVRLEHSVDIGAFAHLTILEPTVFGLQPPNPPAPILFAVPEWPLPTAEQAPAVQRTRRELTKAVRETAEALIGPALELDSDDALTALEAQRVTDPDANAGGLGVAATPLAARVLLVVDMRWPGSDDLPCQMVVSAYAVGSRDDKLWNCRRLLFQDFVELPKHELRADGNQSGVLVRVLMPVLDALRRWPEVEMLLAGHAAVPSPDDLSDILFPIEAVRTPSRPETQPTHVALPVVDRAAGATVPTLPPGDTSPSLTPATGARQ